MYLHELEVFTCHLYRGNGVTDVNELRYQMFCAKKVSWSPIKLLFAQGNRPNDCNI